MHVKKPAVFSLGKRQLCKVCKAGTSPRTCCRLFRKNFFDPKPYSQDALKCIGAHILFKSHVVFSGIGKAMVADEAYPVIVDVAQAACALRFSRMLVEQEGLD